MAISFNCLERSLEPFVPDGPLDLYPIEKIEDWFNYKRMLAKATASKCNLRADEFELFEGWWALSEHARGLRDVDHLLDAVSPMGIEVRAAVGRLAAIFTDSAEYEQRGYQHVRRVPTEGRYVVFSDHHMGFDGSRHDFFSDVRQQRALCRGPDGLRGRRVHPGRERRRRGARHPRAGGTAAGGGGPDARRLAPDATGGGHRPPPGPVRADQRAVRRAGPLRPDRRQPRPGSPGPDSSSRCSEPCTPSSTRSTTSSSWSPPTTRRVS